MLIREAMTEKLIFENFQILSRLQKNLHISQPTKKILIFLLQSNLYIMMTLPSNFYSVWTFLWAAMTKNIFEKCSLGPAVIGLKQY